MQPALPQPIRSFSLLLTPRPPSSTLFPYTTLFRSSPAADADRPAVHQPIDVAGGEVGPRQDVPRLAAERRGRRACDEAAVTLRSEEHTSEPQSPVHLVRRLLLEKKNKTLVHERSNP